MADEEHRPAPVPEAAVAGDWTVLGAIAAVAAVLFLWRKRRRPAA
jgi:LPXTG-motif cell wall-anchored protein